MRTFHIFLIRFLMKIINFSFEVVSTNDLFTSEFIKVLLKYFVMTLLMPLLITPVKYAGFLVLFVQMEKNLLLNFQFSTFMVFVLQLKFQVFLHL
jgi:hypothetical protein